MSEPATKQIPRFIFQPHSWGVDRILHQPVYPALRPDAHRMKHKIGNAGLWPLVHHVVVFVNMKNVRWEDVVCPQFRPPSRESMIVTLQDHRHRTISPVHQKLKAHTWLGQLIEIVEINIKDGVHPGISPGENKLY
jgi:hypothetical protein